MESMAFWLLLGPCSQMRPNCGQWGLCGTLQALSRNCAKPGHCVGGKGLAVDQCYLSVCPPGLQFVWFCPGVLFVFPTDTTASRSEGGFSLSSRDPISLKVIFYTQELSPTQHPWLVIHFHMVDLCMFPSCPLSVFWPYFLFVTLHICNYVYVPAVNVFTLTYRPPQHH